MALLSSFNEDRPVTYFRGYPIYYATILTIAYAAGVVVTFFGQATGNWSALASFMAIDSARTILGGQIWQILTYSFIDFPSFFTIIGLLFLYVAAIEVEKYIGKARFLTLYGVILLIPVVTLTLFTLVTGTSAIYFGHTEVSIGLFIAFCTLYPGIQWGGFISAKWVAIASLVLSTMVDLSSRSFIHVTQLWLISGFSFGYIRFLQNGGELPSLRISSPFRRRPTLRVVQKPKARPRPAVSTTDTKGLEIDHLLEKISRHGLGSLSRDERAALERARKKLLEKDQN